MDFEQLLKQFKLLGDIMKQPDGSGRGDLLSGLDKIINTDIPAMFNQGVPPEYFEMFTELRSLFGQFENFILYDRLIGKDVVALGGGFSSGKSSFMNAIDGENALPEDISPSTAVPTFIVNGEKHEAFGVNIFNAKMPIGLRDIRSVSHGFGEIKDEDEKVVSPPVTLGHVLKSLFLATPKQKFKNMAFVDTPGFSKPDSDTYSARTDENISRAQLNSSTYIMIFAQADAGTLKDEDINFIKSLRPEIPKLFVISKADNKTDSDIERIKSHIKSQLTMNGIANEGVMAFSTKRPDEYDSAAIRKVLEDWNDVAETPLFARNFKLVFIKCRNYYEKTIDDERRALERLNRSLTLISSDDSEAVEPLYALQKEARAKVERLKAGYDKLLELKNALFTELKRVCDIIGIDMPEPSEVDLREDDVPDALEVLRSYKKNKGVKPRSGVAAAIREAFADIVSGGAFARAIGGKAKREEIARMIRENIMLDAADMRINKDAKLADVFKTQIGNGGV
jgi:GTP-binding protein EngB required for normal cell division